MKEENIENTVCFVGAGPGDVDLITVKGLKLLQGADCIIYAGSLVNPEILDGCKAEIHDSSGLYLEQIVKLMVDAWKSGKKVVRLHTGDPSIFGAIKEQMHFLDLEDVPYTIIPGVSSAFGAAAALKAELTLPEVSQTVIITRLEGRTPVPELEKLHLLAKHQCTILIFLSVSMIDRVVSELLQGGYSLETPIAVVQNATWDKEYILRGNLQTIKTLVQEKNITKTAIICVGEVFSDDKISKLSKLYDKNFSHGTRNNG